MMFKHNLISVCIGSVFLFSIILIGQSCLAQGLCDPDPCVSITNAVAGTCTEITAGACSGAPNYVCSCDQDYTWQGGTHTCVGGQPPQEMAQIPTGCFDMGDEGYWPVHNVCISAFEMDVHEVTNAEYAECVDGGGCAAKLYTESGRRTTYYGDPAYDDFPVIAVDWYHAEAYCTWAGKRLPTEAEWEYAARGGLSGKIYPWGDTITCDDANYGRATAEGECYDYAGLENDTSPVGYYAANGYGLYDMAGNVWEWVNDRYDYDHNYYSVSPTNDPPGPVSGTQRVYRGGGWNNVSWLLAVTVRDGYNTNTGTIKLGFRCARGGAYGP